MLKLHACVSSLRSPTNMSDVVTAMVTSSLNQTSVTNKTFGACGQVSASAHICFMLLCSLVFLVSFIDSLSLNFLSAIQLNILMVLSESV